MEKAHLKAVTAIETFVAQLSTADPSPRFVTNLIENATSSPNTFVFGELLDCPAVQKLRDEGVSQEHLAYLTSLEIFAWGTWEEYHSTPNLPPLNEPQQEKLRLLSLITLAQQHVPLPYDTVMNSLALETTSALEALVTKAIYLDLISAKMSPATSPAVIYVTATAPMRDIRPNSLPNMLSSLNAWRDRCLSAVSYIEQQIENIHKEAEARHEHEQQLTERQKRLFPNSPVGTADEAVAEDTRPISHAQRLKRQFKARGVSMDTDEDSDL